MKQLLLLDLLERIPFEPNRFIIVRYRRRIPIITNQEKNLTKYSIYKRIMNIRFVGVLEL